MFLSRSDFLAYFFFVNCLLRISGLLRNPVFWTSGIPCLFLTKYLGFLQAFLCTATFIVLKHISYLAINLFSYKHETPVCLILQNNLNGPIPLLSIGSRNYVHVLKGLSGGFHLCFINPLHRGDPQSLLPKWLEGSVLNLAVQICLWAGLWRNPQPCFPSPSMSLWHLKIPGQFRSGAWCIVYLNGCW